MGHQVDIKNTSNKLRKKYSLGCQGKTQGHYNEYISYWKPPTHGIINLDRRGKNRFVNQLALLQ